jgi:uncharacterized RDD family membrane protein YckC
MLAATEIANNPLASNKKVEEKQNIKIIGFDAERFRAPFTLRCAALLLDYLLLLIAPVGALMMAHSAGLKGAKLLDYANGSLTWVLTLLVLLTNFVVLPVFFGFTIGKFAMGLRVVCRDGGNLSYGAAALRHLVGYAATILTGGLGFLLAIFNSQGRSLHDLIAGTVVVQANQRQLRVKEKV